MSDQEAPATSGCPDCARLRRELDAALQRIAELEALVHELRLRLDRNASNSSIPPSANPPGAPKPVVKARSRRKRGGQPGHPGYFRRRLPPERVDAIVDHVPASCAACHAPLPEESTPGDPEPTWHQVAEIPDPAVIVTEHRGHARTCPSCGEVTRAAIPEPIAAHVIGPRPAALMSYLVGRHHLSRRGAQEFVEDALGVPVSLGTVGAQERQTAAALAAAHDEAGEAVRTAPARNVDETGWKQAGQKRWLWAAATATVAFFVIHARRNWEGLKALLGEAIAGIVCSDRWGTYNRLPLEQRQVCWAHLDRDFRKCVDRGGEAEAIGRAGQEASAKLFAAWWDFRQREIDREGLQAVLDPVAGAFRAALERGCGCADMKAATFCENLLALYPALWLFAACEGVEPTNNHAERIVRGGVLWRKNAFGSHSEGGCRFAERMLTVVQTLRLQHRSVLAYLEQAIAAHRRGEPAPKLLG
jgi:transposase